MEDSLTLAFVVIVIVASLYFGQIWLSIIFGVVLIALLVYGSRGNASGPSPSGPAVRPIIVKRKYVGPESIYPQEMKIRVTSEKFGTGMPWRVSSPQKFGESIGKLLGGLFGRKEEKKGKRD